ncbi:hypothetical protein GCM10011575_02250 [Microlunatus endophyticus]|uniref:Hydrolase of the HAD superfamily n=1 Tax=Microlunatus endophyticus TaxID=1716077 RepID=A0A917VZD9_9ACTN|nr:HAD family hydrolase [Microlunatus endophyticus]GGL47866.1 hypothetical protein GCM10011575_02250 [Microlunatus endophyticus]
MAATEITHLLLDFFGTIVEYSPSRTEQDYSTSYGVLRRLGATLSYDSFLTFGDATFSEHDTRCAADLSEFSMQEPSLVIMEQAIGRAPTPDETTAFVEAYLSDWNSAVLYPAGMSNLLEELAEHFRLAVVSNTHSQRLVPDHLQAMGVADLFDAVVLSVDIGHRKPHPAIYRAALDRLGVDASRALFVGDTYAADYEGPRQQGIRALLIDPRNSAPIPPTSRLVSLFDLPGYL